MWRLVLLAQLIRDLPPYGWVTVALLAGVTALHPWLGGVLGAGGLGLVVGRRLRSTATPALDAELARLAAALTQLPEAPETLLSSDLPALQPLIASLQRLRETRSDSPPASDLLRGQIAQSASQLSLVSMRLSGEAQKTLTQSDQVSQAAEQVSRNMQAVAASIEELSVSIEDIAGHAEKAEQVAGQGVEVAADTHRLVESLGTSSAQIDRVIRLIKRVAGQTRMLALNATIEAVRAGAAGRGFAVVASEVKALAGQTEAATGEISTMLEAIRGDAARSIEAIERIDQVIGLISGLQNHIAVAVREQSGAVGEIHTSVQEVAGISLHIAQSIHEVVKTARGAARPRQQLAEAVAQLEQMCKAPGAPVGPLDETRV